MKFICLLIPLFLCSLAGCVEYHPYDMKTDGQRFVNSTNISKIEKICDGRTSIRFAVVSDSQRWYDELDKIVGAINGYDNIDFVIHAGDLTDFGLKTEFERQRDILNKLEIPYVCLIGNHDCIAMGKSLYYRIFGNPDFSFVAGNVKFLCLNTNMLEYRDDANVPNMDFMDSQLLEIEPGVEKSVAVMHAQPRSDQFYCDSTSQAFHGKLLQFPDLQFCIHGHGHIYKEEDIFGDGIMYYECDDIGDKSFLIFTIDERGYSCEKIGY